MPRRVNDVDAEKFAIVQALPVARKSPAATMVMPRSFSWGIQSIVAVPSSTLPMRWTRPV
jgi:hypothetical protein